MKKSLQSLSELQVAAWILVLVLVALVLMLGSILWKQVFPEFSPARQQKRASL